MKHFKNCNTVAGEALGQEFGKHYQALMLPDEVKTKIKDKTIK